MCPTRRSNWRIRISPGFGSDGSAGADAAALDGVRIDAPDGQPLSHVRLPERYANVCFGDAKGNRLVMAATRPL